MFDDSKFSEDLGRIALRPNECINLILKTPGVEMRTELMWAVTAVPTVVRQTVVFSELQELS
jgi:hypothetical protein